MSSGERGLQRQAHTWRAIIDDPAHSADQRRAFDRWMAEKPEHRAAYAQAEVIWRRLGQAEYDPGLDEPLAREWWQAKRSAWRSRAQCAGWPGTRVLLASGCALLIAALVWIGSDEPIPGGESFRTAIGKRMPIELEDGSRLVLGADTHIVATFTERERHIELLQGDAYFDVSRDPSRPFEVESALLTVRVTGTAFDLQTSVGAASVAVAEGHVQVTHRAPQQGGVSLSAGERVNASPLALGNIEVVPEEHVGRWLDGRLIYERARLTEVVDDINRHHERPVRLDPSLADLRLSGRFRSQDIDVLLNTLDQALPIQIIDVGYQGLLLQPDEVRP